MKNNKPSNLSTWLAYIVLGFVPGLAWVMCGFPRMGILFASLLIFTWVFFWPFAIPLHLLNWAINIDLLRKRDAGELGDS